MKIKNVFWGIFFLAAAILVIVNQLGYLTGINLFSLICTIFLICIIIKSAMYLNFGGILFPFAILGIIYAEPLGIQELVPWPILAAALFATIGLSFLFHRAWNQRWQEYKNKYHNEEGFEQIINDADSETVKCKVSFGSSIKYVNTEDFKKGYFFCSFGAMKIYFDNAKIKGEEAEIYVENSFGGMELYLPKEWNVINGINCSLAGVEEKNSKPYKEGAPVVKLKGKASFSGIEIIYI